MTDRTIASDFDHRIIDAVSVALRVRVGLPDDVERLKFQVAGGVSPDTLKTACEIAIAFIRWSQDLKRQNMELSGKLERIERERLESAGWEIKTANPKPLDATSCKLWFPERDATAPSFSVHQLSDDEIARIRSALTATEKIHWNGPLPPNQKPIPDWPHNLAWLGPAPEADRLDELNAEIDRESRQPSGHVEEAPDVDLPPADYSDLF